MDLSLQPRAEPRNSPLAFRICSLTTPSRPSSLSGAELISLLSDLASWADSVFLQPIEIRERIRRSCNRINKRGNGGFIEAIPLHVSISQFHPDKNPSHPLYRHPSDLSGRGRHFQPSGHCTQMPRHGQGNGHSDRKRRTISARWHLQRETRL